MYASVNWAIFGSDNGLSPGRHQAIIQTGAGISLIRLLGTNFSEILFEIHTFFLFFIFNSFENIVWKMAAILSRSQFVNTVCPNKGV